MPHSLRLSHHVPSRYAILIINSDARFNPFHDGVPDINPDQDSQADRNSQPYPNTYPALADV